MSYLLILAVWALLLQYSNSDLTIKKKLVSLNKSPDLRSLKRALGYSEDTYLNFTELTTKYGYPTEEHIVTTKDGYILTIYRLLTRCSEVQGYPVILMHGIIDSSDAWIITKPKNALGYILADNCYDVWAANSRGNVYSRKHVKLDPDRNARFWDFSFEEAGTYDIPAIIDYILLKTRKRQVFYIGHSQGTTDFFVTGSLRSEYNDKVRLSIHIAPIAWLGKIGNPLIVLLTKLSNEIFTILSKAGYLEVAGKNQYVPHELTELLCQILPLEVCGTIFQLGVGARHGIIPPKTLSVAFGHIPVGTSLKTLEHFAQLVKTGKFQRFDEGREGNMKKYGTIKPPNYDIRRITSPVVLIAAKNDWLSNLEDIKMLESKLPNLLETYIVPNPDWSHNDHLWGTNATQYDFAKILQYFKEFSNT